MEEFFERRELLGLIEGSGGIETLMDTSVALPSILLLYVMVRNRFIQYHVANVKIHPHNLGGFFLIILKHNK